MDSLNIRKITETILFEPVNYKGISEGLYQLHQLFAASTGIAASHINDEDIYLATGKAISPIKAAHCLIDIQRTSVFLRGIYKAILQLKTHFPNERLHILYAGCGPYATLLTPLTAIFSADELAFHLLDISEASIIAAQKIFEELGLTAYVEEWICADAATYMVPAGEVRHLMISETMQTALRREPQVNIMKNLIPQLPINGLFIPEKIAVTATLLSNRVEMERHLHPECEPERISLGRVYTIGQKEIDQQCDVVVSIPPDVGPFKKLYLITDITTFADEKLGVYDSSLNMPWYLFSALDNVGKQFRFSYRQGEVPGFEVTALTQQ